MAWIASLLLFAVLGAGAIGIAMYRRSIRADDVETRELPPDVLIALGRTTPHAETGAVPSATPMEPNPPSAPRLTLARGLCTRRASA
jgi:hypothetical protein